MERLSRIIQNEVECKRWILFKIRSFQASHLFYADDVTLFGAATLDNLGNMMGTLKKFGTIFGLHINVLKSRLIFPNALNHRLRRILSKSVDIPASTAFGKYLGNPLVSLKPKPKDYEELVLKFTQRLAGWQTKFLNFAGRTALIESVLSSMPVYHMQTTLLPAKTMNQWSK